jgi:hypothetical protein
MPRVSAETRGILPASGNCSVKPRICARAGIPLYLLIDRFTEPFSVTLLSQPRDDGDAKADTVIVGEKLRLPAPFDVTIDTSTLPLPR